MSKEQLKAVIGGGMLEDSAMSDTLAIALCTYFEKHMNRPDDDPEDDEKGWSKWVIEKCEEALDLIVADVTAWNQRPAQPASKAVSDAEAWLERNRKYGVTKPLYTASLKHITALIARCKDLNSRRNDLIDEYSLLRADNKAKAEQVAELKVQCDIYKHQRDTNLL